VITHAEAARQLLKRTAMTLYCQAAMKAQCLSCGHVIHIWVAVAVTAHP